MSPEAQIRQRIEDLEEENHYLRQLLLPVEVLPFSWGLNSQQTLFAVTLARAQGCVRKNQVRAALGKIDRDYSDRYLEVQLHYTRKKLKPLGVEILTRHSVGLFMPPESRAIVLAALAAVKSGQVS